MNLVRRCIVLLMSMQFHCWPKARKKPLNKLHLSDCLLASRGMQGNALTFFFDEPRYCKYRGFFVPAIAENAEKLKVYRLQNCALKLASARMVAGRFRRTQPSFLRSAGIAAYSHN